MREKLKTAWSNATETPVRRTLLVTAGLFIASAATIGVLGAAGKLDDPSDSAQQRVEAFNLLCLMTQETCKKSFEAAVGGLIGTIDLAAVGMWGLGEFAAPRRGRSSNGIELSRSSANRPIGGGTLHSYDDYGTLYDDTHNLQDSRNVETRFEESWRRLKNAIAEAC